MAEMHRLNPKQLLLGEPLPWDVCDRNGQLLLRRGYVVQREPQIERLLEIGMYVDAEEYRLYAEQHDGKRAMDPLAIWKEVQGAVGGLCSEPPKDGSFASRVQTQAKSVMSLCGKHPELVLAAIQLLEFRRYPLAHSLHVAALCELVARKGDFDEEARLSLCCAALTENAAMHELQHILYFQKPAPTLEQRKDIQEHPMRGARFLQDCGVADKEWLRAVLEHHETPEGTGYPRKLQHPSVLALLIHDCDVYAAKLTGRATRKALSAPDAAKRVYLELAHGKENPFAGLLLKEVGMYPPGTFVKLASGEVGVVWKRNPEQGSAPVVAVLVSAKGLKHMDPVRRDSSSHDQHKIVAVLPRENSMMAINFDQLWGRALI
jgi:HD-GYP domain-containing protein (c-di-GMP phosphodiesterase class II)